MSLTSFGPRGISAVLGFSPPSEGSVDVRSGREVAHDAAASFPSPAVPSVEGSVDRRSMSIVTSGKFGLCETRTLLSIRNTSLTRSASTAMCSELRGELQGVSLEITVDEAPRYK